MTVTQDQQLLLKRMIQRCQSDAGFRRQLIEDPESVFQAMGLEYSEQLIRDCRAGHLALPLKSDRIPEDKNLDDQSLQQIAGGIDPDPVDPRISEHEMEYLSRLLISERHRP